MKIAKGKDVVSLSESEVQEALKLYIRNRTDRDTVGQVRLETSPLCSVLDTCPNYIAFADLAPQELAS